jgi:signal transduction histidine kinase
MRGEARRERLPLSSRAERVLALATLGALLAAVRNFGPLLWPYGLGPNWSLPTQVWFFIVDLLWVAAMCVTYWRWPAGRMWKLFLAYQIVGTLLVIWIFPTSLTWTFSQALIGVGSVVFVHLVLAFPSGRLTDRYDRLLVIGGYAFIAVTRVLWLVTWDTPFHKDAFTPGNPFKVWPDATLNFAFGQLAILLITPVLLAAVVIGLWRHWQRATPAMRRALLPIMLAAPIQLGLTVAWHIADASPTEASTIRALLQHPAAGLAGVVFPLSFLVGLLRARLARGGIADLAVELGKGVPLGGLRNTLARALRDPTLVLAFPAPSGDGYVDSQGRAVALPTSSDGDRGSARLERDGETLAVLSYDAAIEREDPGRVDAVASVAQMALENERLAAQVRAQLAEVRASRMRIVEAGDAERKRIERDLHDGAQQRLVALAMRLDQARGQSLAATELIDATTTELMTAVQEVRDISRGLHPTILTESGLAAAVEALAERTPFPVKADVVDKRFADEVEVAAYYVIAEGLTNVAKYARATEAHVEVHEVDGQLVVKVTDNGRGGADPNQGSGLRGLSDRVAAIGGQLKVTSKRGSGTTLMAELPTTA